MHDQLDAYFNENNLSEHCVSFDDKEDSITTEDEERVNSIIDDIKAQEERFYTLVIVM